MIRVNKTIFNVYSYHPPTECLANREAFFKKRAFGRKMDNEKLTNDGTFIKR